MYTEDIPFCNEVSMIVVHHSLECKWELVSLKEHDGGFVETWFMPECAFHLSPSFDLDLLL